MKVQSAKGKGRRLQQKVVADLYEAFPDLGDGDLRSTSMGCSGEDVQMSAAARSRVPFSFEAKNQERVNVWNAFEQCKANCGAFAPALVLKRNYSDMLCVIPWATFLQMLQRCGGDAAVHATTKGATSMDASATVHPDPVPTTHDCAASVAEQLRAIADRLEREARPQTRLPTPHLPPSIDSIDPP
jgi:hypothetical protein